MRRILLFGRCPQRGGSLVALMKTFVRYRAPGKSLIPSGRVRAHRFGHHALAFLNRYFLVCLLGAESVHGTGRPPNRNGINARG